MTWLLTFLSIALILLGPDLAHRWRFLADSAMAEKMQKEIRGNTTPPARDPRLAIEEEYQLALQRNTIQALELFIARHSDDPLAEKARIDLQRLSR
jgi:hypothetical protein